MVLEPEVHVVCEDLFKIYKITDLEVVALRGLDLKVNRGEIIAIVGASGSGKTRPVARNIIVGMCSMTITYLTGHLVGTRV